jgi:hypothetical protein
MTDQQLFTVRDNFFPRELVRAAEAEWPDKRWPWWHVYGDSNARKLASKDPLRLPPACQLLIHSLAALPVGEWFQDDRVFPDLTLHGAGLHDMGPNGHLERHLDSDHHPTLGWKREISGVLFLNSRWDDDWGGALQLLDADGQTVIQEFVPRANRLVLFRCHEQAWHRVQPVSCTPDESRKTLAMFWWSTRPSAQARPTSKFFEADSSRETEPCAVECVIPKQN